MICPALVMPTDASLVLGREANERRQPTARLALPRRQVERLAQGQESGRGRSEKAEEDWGGKRSARGMSFQMTRLRWEQFAQKERPLRGLKSKNWGSKLEGSSNTNILNIGYVSRVANCESFKKKKCGLNCFRSGRSRQAEADQHIVRAGKRACPRITSS